MKLLMVLLTLSWGLTAQNLVQNPSFEDTCGVCCPAGSWPSFCATSSVQYTAPGWKQVTGHSGTADQFHGVWTQYTSYSAGVPTNNMGKQVAATGVSYGGTFLHSNSIAEAREYIQASLTTPLVAGQVYQVSIKLSLAERSALQVKDYQAYFSTSALSCISCGFGALPVIPQVDFNPQIITYTDWYMLSGLYTASGGESFVTFGNFNTYGNSTYTAMPIGSVKDTANVSVTDYMYVYLDDAVVQPLISLNTVLVYFKSTCVNDELQFNWSAAQLINCDHFEIEYLKDGVGEVIAFVPLSSVDQDGNYGFLSANHRKGEFRLVEVTSDGSRIVKSSLSADCTEMAGNQVSYLTEISGLLLQFNGKSHGIEELSIYDANGKRVFQTEIPVEFGQNLITIPNLPLSAGVYLLNITEGSTPLTMKFSVF